LIRAQRRAVTITARNENPPAIESERVKYLPLVWAAFRRHTTESLLTFLVLTVAFTLFGSMVALKAAYENAINVNRMDRLWLTDRFCCTGLGIGLRGQISRIPGVQGLGLMQGLLGYYQDPARPLGIAMVDEATVSALPELRLTANHWKEMKATPAGLFFARTEAARWHVKPGDTFPVITRSPEREDGNTAWQFTVLGVVDDPVERIDWLPHIYGNYAYFDTLRTQDKRGTTMFVVSVDDPEKSQRICQTIDGMYANSRTPTYCVPLQEDARQMAASIINLRQLSLGIAAAGLFMILFLCANGTAESVRERLPEFAVLKTIGFDDRALATVIFLEAALPCVAGAVLGTAVAWALGILAPLLAERGVLDIPPPSMSLSVLALALAAALLIAGASAVLPLRRLVAMDLATVLAGR
jgi:putative ABC transport system permease protein